MLTLQELRELRLVFHPFQADRESDDRVLLELAAKHGALILSNDKFRNHPEYLNITTTQIVRYKRKKVQLDEEKLGQEVFPIDCRYFLYGSKCNVYFIVRPS